MPKYYVTDEIGNKYESMSKAEILETIGAGGEREHVFTGEVLYNNEIVDYTYTGAKPSDDIIIKLLETGINPEKNQLTSLEISTIVNLNDFTIHYYYSNGELYVSNRNDKSIKFFKEGIGVMTLYANNRRIEYYVKSNKKIDNIVYCTKEQFKNESRQKGALYIVDNVEYTPNIIIEASCNPYAKTISTEYNISNLDVNKADRYIMLLDMANDNDETHLLYLKCQDVETTKVYIEDDDIIIYYNYFTFTNGEHTVVILNCSNSSQNSIDYYAGNISNSISSLNKQVNTQGADITNLKGVTFELENKHLYRHIIKVTRVYPNTGCNFDVCFEIINNNKNTMTFTDILNYLSTDWCIPAASIKLGPGTLMKKSDGTGLVIDCLNSNYYSITGINETNDKTIVDNIIEIF